MRFPPHGVSRGEGSRESRVRLILTGGEHEPHATSVRKSHIPQRECADNSIVLQLAGEVERLFRQLKGFCGIFPRFEKPDAVFPGFIVFVLVFKCVVLALTCADEEDPRKATMWGRRTMYAG